MTQEILYLGTKGSITALERETGERLWTTHLKGAGFVSIMLEGDAVIAHTNGHLFRVDRLNGKVIWENELKGLGYGYGTMATVGSVDSTAAAAQMAAQAAASSAAASSAAATTAATNS